MQRADAWREVAARVGERYPSTCLDFRTHSFHGRIGEILEACPAGSVPVAYSMGGRLALHAALRDPGRFGALVVVGASAGIEDPGERARRRLEDEELAGWTERHPIEEVVERWEQNPVFASQSPDAVRAQRAGRMRHDPAQLAALLRSAGQGALEPVWERLGELRCPVIAMAGEEDGRYLAAARRIAEGTGGAAASAPGGHAPHLEHPEAFAARLVELLEPLQVPSSGRVVT